MAKFKKHNFRFQAVLSSLPDIDQKVGDLLMDRGLIEQYRNEISLVIEEILTNIIKYGYSNPEEQFIELELGFKKNSLNMVITDWGIAFDPTKIELPDTKLSPDERNVGGLGLFLVQKLMDKVEYRRENHRNILTIEKNF